MRCPARNSQAEFSAMLGSTTWFTVPWSRQIHQQSRSPRVSAETTVRDPMAWCCYHGSRGAVPHEMGQLLTHWLHPTCRKMHYRQEVLQRPRLRERRPSTVRSLPLTCFIPVAVETLGPLSDEAHSLLAEIGTRAKLCTANQRETTFLYQRISVAIQRFNAVCLANTFTVSESSS